MPEVSSNSVKKKPAAVDREKDGLTVSKNMKNVIIFKSNALIKECKQDAASVQHMNRFE
jgi:hypothetical protein